MNRRVILLVFIPLLVLSCCVAGVAVGVLAFSPLRERVMALLGLRPQTFAAELVPADAIFYISLSYNLQAQPGYETIRRAYLENPAVKRALEDAKNNLKQEGKIDWDTEVAPWLGTEAGIFLLPVSSEELERGEVPLVLLVASRDLRASERFLQRLRELAAEQGPSFEERTYRGTRYWFRPAQQKNEPPIVMATVRDFVVFATREQALQAVVDRAGGQGEALARSERFRRVLQELPGQAVVLGYVDYPAFLKVAQEALLRQPGVPSLQELVGTGPSAELVRATEAFGFSGELLPEGMRMQVVMLIRREGLSPEARALLDVPPITEGMFTWIPEDALVLFQSPQIGKQLQRSLDAIRAMPDAARQLEDMEKALGIDIERDLLSWMTGDLAIIVQPVLATTVPGMPVGVSALIGTDRPDDARVSLERLESVLRMGGVLVEAGELQGRPMRMVIDPNGMRVAAYAVGPEVVGIGVPPEALVKSHPERGPERTIRDNPRFQEVLRRLPERRNTLLFIDAQGIWNLVEGQLPPDERETFRRNARPFLDPVRGIGIASEALPGPAVQRGVVFLQITPP
ncbi:hypothetical protein HRbin22_00958 [Candidatus Thermoflexus japonica]|uniref:DUF3352 domain-containing protein n=1 Tax=Candidatus Thermoflexus japonica TaxID=2035417 RepID=A0A2H5Y5I2_9CHLR|nr:hypothetical protein HRbin22_00958 [Candidatus Thermoflexus japonica]